MFQGLRTVVYYVTDLEQAKSWYTEMLGFAPYYDTPYYVGFNVGGYELGLHPREAAETPGTAEKPGAVTYWGVPDINDSLARLLAAGATEFEPILDVGEGIQLAAVKDPSGNVVGIIQNPHFSLKAAK